MPAHIPPGREHLWQRQAEANAEVARLEAESKAAEHKALDLAQALHPNDSIVEDADAEVERLWTETSRAQAVADRVWEERTAGLTSWIDENPTDPICPDCQGTGGPPGCDALGACGTCRGWGREYRPPIPVWHDAHSGKPAGWYDPATGRAVDLFATGEQEPPTSLKGSDVNEATKGVVEGVSKITPTGLATSVASGVTGKDIKSPMAEAATGGTSGGCEHGYTPNGGEYKCVKCGNTMPIMGKQAAATGGATSGGGTGMASIEEVRTGIDAAKEKASESLGALQQAQSALEEAQAQMQQVTEGSGQSDTDEANAALARAVETVTEAQQNAQVAIEAAETVVARL